MWRPGAAPCVSLSLSSEPARRGRPEDASDSAPGAARPATGARAATEEASGVVRRPPHSLYSFSRCVSVWRARADCPSARRGRPRLAPSVWRPADASRNYLGLLACCRNVTASSCLCVCARARVWCVCVCVGVSLWGDTRRGRPPNRPCHLSHQSVRP